MWSNAGVRSDRLLAAEGWANDESSEMAIRMSGLEFLNAGAEAAGLCPAPTSISAKTDRDPA